MPPSFSHEDPVYYFCVFVGHLAQRGSVFNGELVAVNQVEKAASNGVADEMVPARGCELALVPSHSLRPTRTNLLLRCMHASGHPNDERL